MWAYIIECISRLRPHSDSPTAMPRCAIFRTAWRGLEALGEDDLGPPRIRTGRNTMTVQGPCAAFCMVAAAALLTVAGLTAPGARAEVVSDFYRGKTLNVLIGVGAGGEYDLQARLIAKHIGRH